MRTDRRDCEGALGLGSGFGTRGQPPASLKPLALAVEHIVDRCFGGTRFKQIASTAVTCPIPAVANQLPLTKSARCVGLEGVKYGLRRFVGSNHRVNVLGTNVEREQQPFSVVGGLANGLLDCAPPLCRDPYWCGLQPPPFEGSTQVVTTKLPAIEPRITRCQEPRGSPWSRAPYVPKVMR